MTEIRTFAEAEAVLEKYMRLTHELTGKDVTLVRTQQLARAVGNPEKNLKIIHVAGTSGKTSTTYFIASLLSQAGKKVGMTISPHIDSIAERVQVNLEPLSEMEFCRHFTEFLRIVEQTGITPSYFELMIVFVYWYFNKIGVDYAVIETGLGGLHDSTNIAEEENKVCVITDIGYDHMHILGNTLGEIAAQKAGIIHDRNTVFMYPQISEVMGAINARVSKQNAKLSEVRAAIGNLPAAIRELPAYQQRNWQLAYYVCTNLPEALSFTRPQMQQSIQQKIPARMDVVIRDNKTIVMDGAHNGQKMEAFITSLQLKYPRQKGAVLLSLKSGKEFQDILPLLRPVVTTLILTTFSVNNDMEFKSINPDILAAPAKEQGFSSVIVEKDQNKAYELLLSCPDELLMITGSFYLIAQLRANHKELRNATD